MKDNYCVIMAGGIGSRFWPLSKTSMPKQFLDILGTGKTLIQQTYERFLSVCPKENIIIVTHEDYKSLVSQQLPAITEDQILTEPERKNTAPCIAYATYKVLQKNKNATFIVAPSDHLVLNPQAFNTTINIALNEAKNSKNLITLGIKPSRPDTGYGYIKFYDDNNIYSDSTVKKVENFTEKPNLATAEDFIQSGDYYWNSGIFIWSGKAIKTEFERNLPDLAEVFDIQNKYYTNDEITFINNTYPKCNSISIDYGILEKSKNVLVVLSDFGWSDLGTWGSVYTHIEKDSKGNAIIAENNKQLDASNNMIYSTNPKKLIVTEGLNDYIVVDTDESLLICRKQEEQKIKQIVSELKAEKEGQYT